MYSQFYLYNAYLRKLFVNNFHVVSCAIGCPDCYDTLNQLFTGHATGLFLLPPENIRNPVFLMFSAGIKRDQWN